MEPIKLTPILRIKEDTEWWIIPIVPESSGSIPVKVARFYRESLIFLSDSEKMD